jgi:hypothetical protein
VKWNLSVVLICISFIARDGVTHSLLICSSLSEVECSFKF